MLLAQVGAAAVFAVSAGSALPRLTARFSANRLLVLSAALFAVSLVACVTVPVLGVLAVLLVPAGTAWLFVLMSVTGTLQVFLPQWVRARGLSTFNMVFAASQAAGALLWGLVAQAVGLVPTFLAAAALMVAGSVTVAVWPLPDVAHLDRDPAVFWRDPELTHEPDPRVGPVMVVTRYVVPPAAAEPFLAAMVPVRRVQLQTGATTCDLYRDGADPEVFVMVASYRHLGGPPASAHRPAHRRGPRARGAGAVVHRGLCDCAPVPTRGRGRLGLAGMRGPARTRHDASTSVTSSTPRSSCCSLTMSGGATRRIRSPAVPSETPRSRTSRAISDAVFG